MKKYLLSCLFTAVMATVVICISCNGQKDLTPPVIEEAGFLPADCDIYYLGDTIFVHFVCSDNVELGNYNIEWQDFYVGCTRARSNLFLLSNKPIPDFNQVVDVSSI